MAYATGKLGSANLAAATNASVYICPALTAATLNIRLCNRNATPAKVRVSIGAAAPAAADYIEYDISIPGNGILEDSALVVSPGEVVVAYSDLANVSVRVHGFERAA